LCLFKTKVWPETVWALPVIQTDDGDDDDDEIVLFFYTLKTKKTSLVYRSSTEN